MNRTERLPQSSFFEMLALPTHEAIRRRAFMQRLTASGANHRRRKIGRRRVCGIGYAPHRIDGQSQQKRASREPSIVETIFKRSIAAVFLSPT
jgi:hypothetical protein